MALDKILFIDTETGGLDFSIHSLLSVAMIVWSDSKVIDAREILINDGKLNVTPTAIGVNQIDLEKHKVHAVAPRRAVEEIDSFLDLHFSNGERITLGGHNITFDVNFLRFFLESQGYPWSRRFSHRHVDTATVLYFLFLAGKLNKKVVSSQEAFDFFSIDVSGRHSALGDAEATASLFSSLLRVVN